ncbi:hypothetical protein GCM10028773_62390 [Spirosoma koreense]
MGDFVRENGDFTQIGLFSVSYSPYFDYPIAKTYFEPKGDEKGKISSNVRL